MALRTPLMPACFLHWTQAAPPGGEDTLRLMSWRRTLTLKGSAFQIFERDVLPLLDGTHTIDQICSAVADTFSADDVVAAIDMLAAQGLVVEGTDDIAQHVPERLTPQLGWLTENAPHGRAAQGFLGAAHVVIFGAGHCGAAAARSLAASGIGRLTIVDPSDVVATDCYFSGAYSQDNLGKNRAVVLQQAVSPNGTIAAHTHRPTTADEIIPLITGASLVLCCLESGELALSMNLNLACRSIGMPWIAASLEGSELVIGPGFFDMAGGPCYQCWRQREMAATPNVSTRYAAETELAARQADLSGQRENLAASADIVGGMLAAEAITWLSGTAPPSLSGSFLTLTLPGLRMEKHTVLRKPGCSVCTTPQST